MLIEASQHLINIPVNKSVYNGYGGEQFSAKMQQNGLAAANQSSGLSQSVVSAK